MSLLILGRTRIGDRWIRRIWRGLGFGADRRGGHWRPFSGGRRWRFIVPRLRWRIERDGGGGEPQCPTRENNIRVGEVPASAHVLALVEFPDLRPPQAVAEEARRHAEQRVASLHPIGKGVIVGDDVRGRQRDLQHPPFPDQVRIRK
ncbi:MAG: hypothetical protein AB7U18_18865, partial [Dehalococcoidia bacterium]